MRTLYYNGSVYIGENQIQEAFVVEGGYFKYVGSYKEAMAYIDKHDRIVDLQHGFVLPGFIDSHIHLLGYGSVLNKVHLADCKSLKKLLEVLGDYIASKSLAPNEWIQGRGWNHDFFEDKPRFPNRYDLDKVSKKNPIIITRACGHICSVNSLALQLAEITRDTPQPAGGRFDVDNNGEPNGIFRENAIDMITKVIPTPSRTEIKTYLVAACKKLNSYGITSCHSDDFITFPNVDYKEVILAYQELEAEGNLTVKVYEQSHFTSLDGLKEFVESGYYTGKGSRYFRIGPLKMLGDGSLGARTAYMTAPYRDDMSTCGIAIYAQSQFDEMIEYAHIHGMQVAIHAIGDKIMTMVMDAIERVLKIAPRKDHRHGIVHCQITTRPLLERFRELELHAYIQSIFLDYDITIIEARIGSERASETYQFKTLMDYGSASNGSDSPVEPPNVMAGMQCAITRSTLDGKVGPFLEGQALSVDEVIKSYTLMGARASFEENEKGSISAGMAADFVILENSPFEMDNLKIKDILIKAVYMDGKGLV